MALNPDDITNAQTAREHFDYHPDGYLIWKKSYRNAVTGKRAGTVDLQGYVGIMFRGRRIRAHRLIFLWHHGYWPELVDHINRDRSDNRIENLRETSHHGNALNACSQDRAKHYSWNSRLKLWVVQMSTATGKKIVKYANTEEKAQIIATELRTIHR